MPPFSPEAADPKLEEVKKAEVLFGLQPGAALTTDGLFAKKKEMLLAAHPDQAGELVASEAAAKIKAVLTSYNLLRTRCEAYTIRVKANVFVSVSFLHRFLLPFGFSCCLFCFYFSAFFVFLSVWFLRYGQFQ
ncbi:unnamed protein product [Polarella glacialis]|uniref:Uncharacterized protein n=1 Tax=Polarella glacialis TaxID=89957 RepID=A0A813G0L7_POLGL|nr:unnamed protein product [Polarella glacialis]